MPKINVNDVSLYYESFGTGTPLIFITGFNTDHLIWQNIVDTYAKNYRVIIFDNRGSGQASSPDYPYTIDMMAQDTVALCEALSINKAHFVGLSMGGTILQSLAKNYPHLVQAAVLNNTTPKVGSRFNLYAQSRLDAFDELQTSINLKKFAISIGLTWGFSDAFLASEENTQAFIELSLANPFPMTKIGFKNQFHALKNFDSRTWVKDIKTPCLVIGSDEDSIMTVNEFQFLAEEIPQAEYYEFKGVGHIPHIERSDIYNEIVLNFFAKYPF